MSPISATVANRTKSFVIGLLVGLVIAGTIASIALALSNRNGFATTTVSSDLSPPSSLHAGSHVQSEELVDDSKENSSISLSELTRLSSRAARTLALQSMIQNLDEKSLDLLWDDSSDLSEQSLRSEVEATIVRKMATIKPEYVMNKIEAYPTARQYELIELIFEEWPRVNLNAAIEYAQRLNFRTRKVVMEAILNASDHLSTNDLLTAARKLGLEQTALERIEERLIEQPILDPEESWKSFVASHHNQFRSLSTNGRELLGNIAQALVDKFGEDAYGLVDQSLSNFYDKKEALGYIVWRISPTNPKHAFDLARNLRPSRDDHTTIWSVARKWASSEPKAALGAVLDVEQGWLRNQLLMPVIEQWVVSNPAGLLENLHRFPNESRTLAERQAWNSIATKTPEQASRKLDTIQNESVKLSTAVTIAKNWATNDIEATLSWVNSDFGVANEQLRLVEVALREFARIDPQKALELALGQAVPDSSVGPEAEVLNTIASIDVEASIELLSKTRNEKTKLAGMISIGSTLLRHFSDPDKAMELSKKAGQDEVRDEYFSTLIPYWSWMNPETLYERIDQFPTKELKSLASQYLIRNEREIFLDEELEGLRSHLTDEARKKLEL